MLKIKEDAGMQGTSQGRKAIHMEMAKELFGKQVFTGPSEAWDFGETLILRPGQVSPTTSGKPTLFGEFRGVGNKPFTGILIDR